MFSLSMKSLLVVLAGCSLQVSAERLLLASYGTGSSAGAIQTLEFQPGADNNTSRKLGVIHENHDCGGLPTWLDMSLGAARLFCVDESSANANFTTLSVESDGSVKKTSRGSALPGAVSLATYNNKSALALAHYGPPAITTYTINADGSVRPLQNITFQEPEKIHQAVLDPTGKYMIFPSLGGNATHVYCIDPATSLLTEHEPLKAPDGYGPRHAVFWTGGHPGTTFLFVVHEMNNRIVSYKVDYPECGGLNFTQVDDVSTYGNQTVPVRTFASEISLSPDNKFVVAGNRNGTIFTVENPDPNNSTLLPSDSLVTFKPSPDGKLSFVQLAKTGGVYPRHFQMNKDGSMIAVANQMSKNVFIYARNLETGMILDNKAVASGEQLGPGDLM
ncbi:hypothetical protein PTNB73_07137 [Pyrenophora teres f. teres]|nr:hypothetical protein PTNB85_09739 [Pyrenophora teres f. teres]KAE8831585.1 hypothetical protein HRS9139_05827 [Pyrenophora teres f. teres]KAE8835675.1 hypothetical protein HRS9122_07945 [Pyrenophora teres f. teres]KAE8861583.1 hypothetical protein PTNB73_07137 [Pyrenophora teres f. teres]CAE7205499.1 3-carboxymuconate cyclase [Pyrenophora teres f. teres]